MMTSLPIPQTFVLGIASTAKKGDSSQKQQDMDFKQEMQWTRKLSSMKSRNCGSDGNIENRLVVG
jgi:hypothetical protein